MFAKKVIMYSGETEALLLDTDENLVSLSMDLRLYLKALDDGYQVDYGFSSVIGGVNVVQFSQTAVLTNGLHGNRWQMSLRNNLDDQLYEIYDVLVKYAP